MRVPRRGVAGADNISACAVDAYHWVVAQLHVVLCAMRSHHCSFIIQLYTSSTKALPWHTAQPPTSHLLHHHYDTICHASPASVPPSSRHHAASPANSARCARFNKPNPIPETTFMPTTILCPSSFFCFLHDSNCKLESPLRIHEQVKASTSR